MPKTSSRLLTLAGAIGLLACDDHSSCPEVPVPIADLDCSPTAVGNVHVPNGSFEARPDPLDGWQLIEADGARVETLAGSDGCTALALAPAGETFKLPAQLRTSVPAVALRGQRVRLSAYTRVEPSESRAGMVLRSVVGSDVTEAGGVGLHGDRWGLHGVEFDVPADADALEIVVGLDGARRVELDGFTLDRVGPACPGCDPPAPLDDRELDKLLAFTRLFGHVRYFYPGDWIEKADWNAIALVGTQAVLRAGSPAALAEAMEGVFQPRAPALEVAVDPPPAPPIAAPPGATRVRIWQHGADRSMRVALDWLRLQSFADLELPDPAVPLRIDLGNHVFADLPLALYATDATLPVPTRVPARLEKPAGFRPDHGDRLTRLAAVAVVAAHMTHFSPHVARRRADWDDVLRDSFTRAAVARDRYGTQRALWRMYKDIGDVAGLAIFAHDAHLSFRMPLRWTWLDGQLIVTAADPKHAPDLRVGDVVEAIDGRPVAARIAEILEYTPGTTETRRNLWALSVLARGPGGPRVLSVRRADGTTAKVRVPMRHQTLAPQVPQLDPITELDGGVLYVRLGIDAGLRDAAFERLARAPAAILDLRAGTDGPMRASFGLSYGDAEVPGVREQYWPEGQDRAIRDLAPSGREPPRLPARLVVLTGEMNMHANELLTDLLRVRHGAVLVGQPTAGASPRLHKLQLPGDMIAHVSEGPLRFASGHDPLAPVEPDILVTPTIEGIRAGRDEVIERALAELRK